MFHRYSDVKSVPFLEKAQTNYKWCEVYLQFVRLSFIILRPNKYVGPTFHHNLLKAKPFSLQIDLHFLMYLLHLKINSKLVFFSFNLIYFSEVSDRKRELELLFFIQKKKINLWFISDFTTKKEEEVPKSTSLLCLSIYSSWLWWFLLCLQIFLLPLLLILHRQHFHFDNWCTTHDFY